MCPRRLTHSNSIVQTIDDWSEHIKLFHNLYNLNRAFIFYMSESHTSSLFSLTVELFRFYVRCGLCARVEINFYLTRSESLTVLADCYYCCAVGSVLFGNDIDGVQAGQQRVLPGPAQIEWAACAAAAPCRHPRPLPSPAAPLTPNRSGIYDPHTIQMICFVFQKKTPRW